MQGYMVLSTNYRDVYCLTSTTSPWSQIGEISLDNWRRYRGFGLNLYGNHDVNCVT